MIVEYSEDGLMKSDPKRALDAARHASDAADPGSKPGHPTYQSPALWRNVADDASHRRENAAPRPGQERS